MDLQQYTSIVQTQAAPTTSGRYSFIPTTRVLSVFAKLGWFPVKASQARARGDKNDGYQRHMLRLANDRFDRELINVGDATPQIALVNSHDAGNAFQLYAAMMEKCILALMHFNFKIIILYLSRSLLEATT